VLRIYSYRAVARSPPVPHALHSTLAPVVGFTVLVGHCVWACVSYRRRHRFVGGCFFVPAFGTPEPSAPSSSIANL
jgi:hypothetical protein